MLYLAICDRFGASVALESQRSHCIVDYAIFNVARVLSNFKHNSAGVNHLKIKRNGMKR